MKIFVCVLVVAFIAWFGYSMYHDGYQSGVFEERRKRIRSLVAYNGQLSELRIEIKHLKDEMEDIRENMPACVKPQTFEVEEVESNVRTAG